MSRTAANATAAAAVAAAARGATVQLSAGTFELTDTLALLRGVTLRGAGRDATVLQDGVTDSEIDNAVAGVVTAGEHRAEIVRTVIERSGQCGVCYLGISDGEVRVSGCGPASLPHPRQRRSAGPLQ